MRMNYVGSECLRRLTTECTRLKLVVHAVLDSMRCGRQRGSLSGPIAFAAPCLRPGNLASEGAQALVPTSSEPRLSWRLRESW